MSAAAEPADRPEPTSRCWCCGTPNQETNLIRLNAHSEVAVCLPCADFLALRARERRDHRRPSLAGRGRDVLRAGRRTVVDHGWHRLPVVGPLLRRVGRYLP
jgi:hypothetical protein